MNGFLKFLGFLLIGFLCMAIAFFISFKIYYNPPEGNHSLKINNNITITEAI